MSRLRSGTGITRCLKMKNGKYVFSPIPSFLCFYEYLSEVETYSDNIYTPWPRVLDTVNKWYKCIIINLL